MSQESTRFRRDTGELHPGPAWPRVAAPDGRSDSCPPTSPVRAAAVSGAGDRAGGAGREPVPTTAPPAPTEAIAGAVLGAGGARRGRLGSVGVTQQLLEAVGEPAAEVALRLALVRGLSHPRRPVVSGGGHGAAAGRDARPAGHGGRGHQPDPAHLRLQPEQPDRHRGARGRAAGLPGPGARRTAWSCWTRPTPSTFGTRQVPDGMAVYRDRPNVAVLRTFSKAYGLAGLRVGFLVAEPPVAAAVARPCSVHGERARADRGDRIPGRRGGTARAGGRGGQGAFRVRDELLAQGWLVPPAEANFVWLRLGEDTQDFAAACARAGVAVRPFGAEGARISIGDHDANDVFLAVARGYPRATDQLFPTDRSRRGIDRGHGLRPARARAGQRAAPGRRAGQRPGLGWSAGRAWAGQRAAPRRSSFSVTSR